MEIDPYVTSKVEVSTLMYDKRISIIHLGRDSHLYVTNRQILKW